MQRPDIRLPKPLLLLALAVWAGPASAACTVNGQSVAFGAYDSLSAAHLDGVGRISVTCKGQTHYTISLSRGNGTYGMRRMAGGTANLLYNLYAEPSRMSVWGDGSGGSIARSGSGTASYSIYGRIPGNQKIRAGAYSDTIVVTVVY